MDDRRVGCEVPGCSRTMGAAVYRRRFKHEPGGWICPKHWALVPRSWKRLLARHRREHRRHGFYLREAAHERLWGAVYRLLGCGE